MSFKEQLEQIKKKCEFDEQLIKDNHDGFAGSDDPESYGNHETYHRQGAKFQHSQLKPVIDSLLEIIELQQEALEFYCPQGDFDLSEYSIKVTEDCGDIGRQTQSKVLEKLKEVGNEISILFN